MICSIIRTTAVADKATVSSPFSIYANSMAAISPPKAEQTDDVDWKIAGNVMAAKTA